MGEPVGGTSVECEVGFQQDHPSYMLSACKVEQMAYEKNILSPQTWSLRLGLDYDQEQKNLAMHRAEV